MALGIGARADRTHNATDVTRAAGDVLIALVISTEFDGKMAQRVHLQIGTTDFVARKAPRLYPSDIDSNTQTNLASWRGFPFEHR